MKVPRLVFRSGPLLFVALLSTIPAGLSAQGVTTSALSGLITSTEGAPPAEAIVVALHVASGTQYRAVARTGGVYSIPNMRVGEPTG